MSGCGLQRRRIRDQHNEHHEGAGWEAAGRRPGRFHSCRGNRDGHRVGGPQRRRRLRRRLLLEQRVGGDQRSDRPQPEHVVPGVQRLRDAGRVWQGQLYGAGPAERRRLLAASPRDSWPGAELAVGAVADIGLDPWHLAVRAELGLAIWRVPARGVAQRPLDWGDHFGN